ncbi:MAG: KEOPS complex kinase/ATPase Bud32 [Candidatus Methanomethylophilaceae archaeon]|nr:Kae1-associated serine/threonine protein kinase [Candidatus Methanomethylophilaceae archaeon]MDD3379115.1 KEOPS complex kinase/ATPase Bud32 [Candidatus Methanomethylophilaceae archaeon]MDY0224514.1 KEOPS complex kinase/ATPase Bud32 [Candidatus Methanomethylophilaceae archaeon]
MIPKDVAPIASGAEADIFETEFLGRKAVMKVRSPKKYRHPELDEHIRTARIRSEVRLMKDAREAGVRTPIIYDLDLKDCSITMEYVNGNKMKDVLDKNPDKAYKLCEMIGTAMANLHNARICHGDLTTSNMILTEKGELCLIDFSMGGSLIEVEDMGVDIRLLERAFASAHPGLEDAYAHLLDTYSKRKTNVREVMEKVEEIKGRGRYT